MQCIQYAPIRFLIQAGKYFFLPFPLDLNTYGRHIVLSTCVIFLIQIFLCCDMTIYKSRYRFICKSVRTPTFVSLFFVCVKFKNNRKHTHTYIYDDKCNMQIKTKLRNNDLCWYKNISVFFFVSFSVSMCTVVKTISITINNYKSRQIYVNYLFVYFLLFLGRVNCLNIFLIREARVVILLMESKLRWFKIWKLSIVINFFFHFLC